MKKTSNIKNRAKLNPKITALVVIVFGVGAALAILLWQQRSGEEAVSPQAPIQESPQLTGLSPEAKAAFERAMNFERPVYVSDDFDPLNNLGAIEFITYDENRRFNIHYLAHENRFRIFLSSIEDEEDFNNVLRVAEEYFLREILKTNSQKVACEFDVLITPVPPDPSSMPKPVPSQTSLTFCDNNTSSGAVNNDSEGSIEAANNSVDRILGLFPELVSLAYAHSGTPVGRRGDCHWGNISGVLTGYTYCGCSSFLEPYFKLYSYIAREAAAQEADCSPLADSGFYSTAWCTWGKDVGLFQIRAGGNCGHCGQTVTCPNTGTTVTLSSDLNTCISQLKVASTNANFACGMTSGGTNWQGFYAVQYCAPNDYPVPLSGSYFQKF